MQKIGYGALNLQPDEFWSLTFAEFNLMIEGYKWREEREWERTAQLAAWIMSPHTKKRITANKLLGKEDGHTQKKKRKTIKVTTEEKAEIMESLDRDLGLG